MGLQTMQKSYIIRLSGTLAGLDIAICRIRTTGAHKVVTEVSSPFKISIWKSFTPRGTLVAQGPEEEDRQLIYPDNLQEEVYSWATSEDPLDGISDDSLRQRLRDHLFDRLRASRPPSERGIDVLREFVTIAETAIASGKTEWTISQSRSDDGEDIADQVNSLLALTLHLKWLVGCFADRPGISVSVR